MPTVAELVDGIVATELRKFNKNQLRDPGGEGGGRWVKAPSAGEVLKDVLKLDGKIDLDPDEELIGSDKIINEAGVVRLAVTRRAGKPSVRLGVGDGTFGTRDDSEGTWRAGPSPSAKINADRAKLRDEMEQLDELDELTPAQQARYDELDDTDKSEVVPSGYTARLDGDSAVRLSTALSDALAKAERVKAEDDARWEEIERLEAEDDRLSVVRDPLVEKFRASEAGGPPISPEDDAELDRLTEQWVALNDRIDAARREYEGFEVYESSTSEGSVPGEWADVHYEVYYDDGSIHVRLAAVPAGMDIADVYDLQSYARLDAAGLKKLSAMLGRAVDPDTTRSVPETAVDSINRHRILAAIGVVERKFNPKQLRDPGGEGGGQWVKSPSAGEVLRDVLKLDGRIELGDDEKLLGSAHVPGDPDTGMDAVLAATRSPDGPRLRIGVVPEEDTAKWRAADKGGTVVLDADGMAKLRADLDEGIDAGRAHTVDFNRRSDEIVSQIAALNKRKDELLQRTFGPKTDYGYAPGEPLPPDLKRELDAIPSQIEDLEASYPESDPLIFEGSVTGGWGDLVYEIWGSDDEHGGWRLDLSVRPDKSHSGRDPRLVEEAEFREPDLRRLIVEIDKLTGQPVPVIDASGGDGRMTLSVDDRMIPYDPEKHPHAPAGTSTGGQFTAAKSGGSKPAPKQAMGKRRPTKHAAPGRNRERPSKDNPDLFFDPAANTGTGYDQDGGDPRVRDLQESLNRFKLTDAKGKRLRVDGELGPLTTQAVKAAQQKLGLKPDGRVTPALLERLTKSKSLRSFIDDDGEFRRVLPDTQTRAFDFELRSASSDGRTLEGYVAVFGATARIADHGGDFDEEIHRGAFDRSLKRSYPVMQFDHGRDPRTGTVPIGVYSTFEPDSRGYYVKGELFDNPVVEPIRQAIKGKAIKGMSWRMLVTPKVGDRWTRRTGQPDKRDIVDADVPEAGPVVFPAYDVTSVSVRSILANFSSEERAALIRELADEVRMAVDLNDTETRTYQDDDEEFVLTDLTTEPDTRSAAGGERETPAGECGATHLSPMDPNTRDRVLKAFGVLTHG